MHSKTCRPKSFFFYFESILFFIFVVLCVSCSFYKLCISHVIMYIYSLTFTNIIHSEQKILLKSVTLG